MKCEWDARKAESNLRKHGVSFEEAATALADDLSVTGADPITQQERVASSRLVCPAVEDSWLSHILSEVMR